MGKSLEPEVLEQCFRFVLRELAHRIQSSPGDSLPCMEGIMHHPQPEALAHLRVVVVGSGSVAINFAGRTLADMGATVVKLEDPPDGDSCRRYPPIADGFDPPSSLFAFAAAGTHSVLVGDGDADRRHRALLLNEADVILHDQVTEAGWLADPVDGRVGRLAVVAVTPYGQFGPKRDVVGTDLTLFQAGGEGYLMPSGLAHEERPDGPPILAGRYVPSYQAGMVAAVGTLVALRSSEVSGVPERVDISIQDAQLSLNHLVVDRWQDGVLERRSNRSFRYGGVLRCRDGYVQILTLEDHQWHGLRDMIGSPGWAFDPALDDQLERARSGGRINAALRAWAASRTRDDVVRSAKEHGVPAGAFLSPADLRSDEQLRARGFFDQGHELFASPFLMRAPARTAPPRRAPRLGEHTAMFADGFSGSVR